MPRPGFRTTSLQWIWLLSCLSISALLIGGTRAELSNNTSPTHQFKSRPDLHAPILNFEILQPEKLVPGLIFFAPYRNVDPGPYIYDNFGQLVWSGAGELGPMTAHTPRVCQYKGTDHLCFFTGEQHQGFARGHGVIMDKHYRVVKQIDSSGAGASSDMHEFKVAPHSDGTTVLMTVYQPRQYDLTVNPRFNIQHGMGWVVEGVFQEIDIETGKVVFEWRSLDHVDPSEAWTLPGTTDTSGTGLHEQEPWDYFHLNSIDKNKEGDYLISARHTSAIYKISGENGSILWQLGGDSGHFEQTNFNFSYQHHARWISENETHTMFSFFDNGSNSFTGTGVFSHGWVIVIDHVAETATMVKEFGAPLQEGGRLSTSQGNMQFLPNGGVHIGWGEHAWFSEHLPNGEATMHARVAERESNVMIYRSNKYNWTAQPVTKPALWTYSKTGDTQMGLWVSWNGATETRSWRFYTGNTANGPWTFAGSVWKTGFETEHHIETYAPWAYAEAVDEGGRVMESSMIARTFVPSERLRPYCDDHGCNYAERVAPENETPYDADFDTDDELLSTNRGYDTSQYYFEVPSEALADYGKSDMEGSARRKTDVKTLVAVVGGTILGALIVLLGWYLQQKDAFERCRDVLTQSSLGSKLNLGHYTRLRQKEPEGFETGLSMSGRRSSSGWS
ncbi:Putative arylsulfotransferase [Septoria linicola]|uniref:Arylsulfotransferase n=1 Tax=Septoria linicola TaxID=215465 RepID=A0A9Q9AY78_9PEZI|nr:putative arylsulfotransferase [Septoria linicola]USW53961.1 Putative arylsulfotransferase [Septoria linicola]